MKLVAYKYRTTKFCAVTLNICGPSEWIVLHVTSRAPIILRWVLDFWNVCAPFMKMIFKCFPVTPALISMTFASHVTCPLFYKWYSMCAVNSSRHILLAVLPAVVTWGTECGLRADFSILSLIRIWSYTTFNWPTFFPIFLHFYFSVQAVVKWKLLSTL
jgi:hypothetical protein